jgi:RNAse (barnase) inhibitor barstar
MSISKNSDFFFIDTKLIKNINEFYDLFAKICNFPDYYGNNMDAWLDCMSDLQVKKNLIFELNHFAEFNKLLPEISKELLECFTFLNEESIYNKIYLVLS